MPKFENHVPEHSFLNFSSVRINGDSLISGCGCQLHILSAWGFHVPPHLVPGASLALGH